MVRGKNSRSTPKPRGAEGVPLGRRVEQPTPEKKMTCQHKRYSVDVHEQTGQCIDCGSEGRISFVVPRETDALKGAAAAAPDLLAALQAVLHWIDENCETTGFEEVEAVADAALAKAGAELFNVMYPAEPAGYSGRCGIFWSRQSPKNAIRSKGWTPRPDFYTGISKPRNPASTATQ